MAAATPAIDAATIANWWHAYENRATVLARMHIPDGFLSTPIWLGLDAAALPAIGYLARRAQRETPESRIPLLGVMGAFVFAAQMINFPVGAGTSGHLVGGALLAITLGPAAAAVTMAAILGLQALIFQDGGVLALGANVVNMAVAGVLAGYLPYYLGGAGRWRRPAIAIAGIVSVLTGAALALVELIASGVVIPASALWVSAGAFAVTGVIEGAITLAVVEAIGALSPTLARGPDAARSRPLALFGALAVVLAFAAAFVASSSPDGLESLASRIGIAEKAQSLFEGPLADYEASFAGSDWMRKGSAGIVGIGLIYGLCALVGRAFSKRSA